MSASSKIEATADPFFAVIRDGQWNACIGVQGDEQDYVDGYLEAALVLAAAVIDKEMMGSRDTLALPILYNGRHALELSLKFAINRLFRMGAIGAPHRPDHDIHSHWKHLQEAEIGDAAIRDLVCALEPFVTSLAKIDDDGQELRFGENREGQKSLDGLAVVNLPHIRRSLEAMSQVLIPLKWRVLEFENERRTGSFTRECSRSDLKEIAAMLGDHETWKEESFLEKKAAVRSRFGLSSNKFSDAANKIRQSRELATLVGIETGLTYLSDDKAIFAIEQWVKARLERTTDHDIFGPDYFDRDWEEDRRVTRELNDAVIANLSDEEFLDLKVLFYIGRGPEFGEFYDEMIARTVKEHQHTKSRWEGVHHIMSKTNLLECVIRGCNVVGRPTLAAKLQAFSG